MPDLLRIIRPSWPAEPRAADVIADLSGGTVVPVRDTFAFQPGAVSGPEARLGARSAGSRVVDGIAVNGGISCEFYVVNEATADLTLARLEATVGAAMRSPAGLEVEWRPDGTTYSTYYELRGPGLVTVPYRWVEFRGGKLLHFAVTWPVGPYGMGRPLDLSDDFDVLDAGWTNDSGSTLVAVGGRLTSTDTGTHRMRWTAGGYLYRDVQTTVRVDAGSLAPTSVNVGKADTTGADSGVFARIEAGFLKLVKRTAGVQVDLASTASTWASASTYYLRFRSEGRVLYAERFDTPPTPLAAPVASTSYVMTDAEWALFRDGHPAFRWIPPTTTETLYAFWVEAFAYRQIATPDDIVLDGTVPGTIPAGVDLSVTTSGAGTLGGASGGSGGDDYPNSALVAFERPVFDGNLVDGRFADYGAGAWVGGAITGIQPGTGTLTAPGGSNKFREASLLVTASAAVGAGAAVRVPKRWQAGITVLTFAWIKAQSGGTGVRLGLRAALGDTTDRQSATVTATSTFQLVGLAATITSRSDALYARVLNPAGVAAAWYVDGAVVCEPIVAVLNGTGIPATTTTTATLTAAVPEAPTGRCYALLLDPATNLAELARATVSGTTVTLERGVEGSTPVTLAGGATLYLLNLSDRQVRGAGGAWPLGFLPATAAASASTNKTHVGDASSSDGSKVAKATAGVDGVTCVWSIDFACLPADDYRATVDVQVYGRFEIDGRVVSPTVLTSLSPIGGGFPRYSQEFGAFAKLMPDPGGVVSVWRTVFLGTFPVPVARADGLSKWALQVAARSGTGSTGNLGLDAIYLVPRSARASSPEQKAYDNGYPKFVEGTAEMRRVVRSDGSGLIQFAAQTPPQTYHGLGGAPLEVDPGATRAVAFVKLASVPIDEPTAGTTDSEWGQHVAAIQASIRPRYRVARGG